MKAIAILAFLLIQGVPASQRDAGVVTGHLRSVDGTPAAGIRVSAMAVPEPAAGNVGSLLAIVETDKDGQYRLENIPPGRYYITAGLVDSPTYYPGALKPEGATVVQILAGKTVENADFTMLAPAGFKVSGKFLVQPSTPISSTIVLTSPLTGAMETAIQPDGTFTFPKVRTGTYTLQPFFGLPTMSLIVTDHDITSLELAGGPGVRVTGSIVSPGTSPGSLLVQTITLVGPPVISSIQGAAAGAGLAGGLVGGFTSSNAQNLTTRTNPDGTFEFLKVPPGNYTIRPVIPAAFSQTQTTSLVVGDNDISGFQIHIPYQAEIPGHVVMADGSRLQNAVPQGIGVEARYSNGTYGTSADGAGTFRLRLSEGEYQIGVRSLPLGLAVQSISSGAVDVMKAPIKIVAGQKLDEIVVTIAAVPLDSIKGVRFSGRVTGLSAGTASSARVALAGSDPGGATIETTLNSDGSFEFAKVPSGTYSARVTGIPNASLIGAAISQRIFVGEDNVSGFQIPLNIRTMVTGKVSVVDASGRARPDVVPSGSVNFRRAQFGSSGTSLRPDGTFQIPLEEGDQTFTLDRMPPQFTIQSITAGPVDLMKSPLKVDRNTPPPEIQIRVEYKP